MPESSDIKFAKVYVFREWQHSKQGFGRAWGSTGFARVFLLH
jgi:hypothetical protein